MLCIIFLLVAMHMLVMIYIYVIEHTRYIWHSIVYQNNIVQCKHYVLQKDKGKLD